MIIQEVFDNKKEYLDAGFPPLTEIRFANVMEEEIVILSTYPSEDGLILWNDYMFKGN